MVAGVDKEKAGITVSDTKQRILKSFDNQILLLDSMLGSLEGDLKETVSGAIDFLETEKEKLRQKV